MRESSSCWISDRPRGRPAPAFDEEHPAVRGQGDLHRVHDDVLGLAVTIRSRSDSSTTFPESGVPGSVPWIRRTRSRRRIEKQERKSDEAGVAALHIATNLTQSCLWARTTYPKRVGVRGRSAGHRLKFRLVEQELATFHEVFLQGTRRFCPDGTARRRGSLADHVRPDQDFRTEPGCHCINHRK